MNNVNANRLSLFKAATSANNVDDTAKSQPINKNEAYDEYAYIIEDEEETLIDDTYKKETP